MDRVKETRAQTYAALKKDCDDLLRIMAQIQNGVPVQSIRRYEWLSFEKCRELILAGADPETVANPYEVNRDG